ncbi:hypothetical protein [Nostoc sp. DSM 114159]|jgi:hypothetical protein
MDWAIGKFTTISQIVKPFGQAVYLDVKQYDNEQSFTARKNLRLKIASRKPYCLVIKEC